MGAWSHNGHLSQQYIDELGKFVDTGPPDEISDFCFARVIGCGLLLVTVYVDTHRAEFVTPEFFSVFSASLLLEEDGAGRGQFDGCAYYDIDQRKHDAKKTEGEEKVEGSFQQAVFHLYQGLLTDSEYGDIAEHLEVHAAMQVVADIRYTVETDQVVFAIVDDGNYLVLACRRQAAIYMLPWVALNRGYFQENREKANRRNSR